MTDKAIKLLKKFNNEIELLLAELEQPEEVVEPVKQPEKVVTVSREELRTLAVQNAKAGYKEDVIASIESYSVSKIQDLADADIPKLHLELLRMRGANE
jgi:hypothetical protein